MVSGDIGKRVSKHTAVRSIRDHYFPVARHPTEDMGMNPMKKSPAALFAVSSNICLGFGSLKWH